MPRIWLQVKPCDLRKTSAMSERISSCDEELYKRRMPDFWVAAVKLRVSNAVRTIGTVHHVRQKKLESEYRGNHRRIRIIIARWRILPAGNVLRQIDDFITTDRQAIKQRRMIDA